MNPLNFRFPSPSSLRRSVASSLPPRAFTTFLVLWTIALVAILLTALQAGAFREAAAGREAVARVRAYWAARAGIEAQISQLTFNTISPDPSSAFTIDDDLLAASRGTLDGSSYTIRHNDGIEERDGPLDAHTKLNINILTIDDLMLLSGMDEATADAILDWIDSDDDPQPLGAELGQYLSAKYPYMPRNGPMRSIQELELVLGVTPEYVRGEDWNLNGVIDPNENDGSLSWPPDNADGKLDAGWSGLLTASSEAGGMAASGVARLDLTTATPEEIVRRFEVDSQQADVISQHAAAADASLMDFIESDLRDLAPSGGTQLSGASANSVRSLTRDQQKLILDEGTLSADPTPRQGKLNINTVPDETLEYLAALDAGLCDSIIVERKGRAGGFTSLADLLDVPAITPERLAELAEIFDVRSNVYIVTSRGRDQATGLEVEIVATVDRSTLPVVLKDLIVR